MTFKVSGVLAAAAAVALTGAASAQSNQTYYQQIQGGYQAGTVTPAVGGTYQSTVTAQPAQPNPTFAPATTYTGQAPAVYAPQQVYTQSAPAITAPQQVTVQQSAPMYSTTTPSYASPYTPTAQTAIAAPSTTYIATPYGGAANTVTLQQPAAPLFQQPVYGGTITAQPLPAPSALPVPATAFTSSVPDSTAPVATATQLEDNDIWSFNLPRFYPAIQACLRKSQAKNPVIANIQVRDNKTMMLIGEGGSSSFSTCSTGLTGTTVKADSDIRTVPPAFFAPLGSTFTVSPDRPFQPIVDTDQKVIGWLVRTQPTRAVNQFGQAAGFDGQFIPPVMVNTSVGKS